MCGPEGLTPVHDQLYRGEGDGTFVEVSVESGFRPTEAGFGLGVTTLDHDLDGDTDLYVTNDSTPNHLWQNSGEGTFAELGLRRGVALDESGKEQAGMGIACADLSGDGFPDLFVTNFSGENNALYQTVGGRAVYRERSHRLGFGGPSIPYLGWGAAAHDYDLDGDVDLAVLNGHVYPQADLPGTDTSYAQPDHLYRRSGARFELEELSDAGATVARALAGADLDGDGDVDLVAYDLATPGAAGAVRVLENTGGAGHWLVVRLAGKGGNTAALGARLVATAGERSWSAEIRTAGGYQAAVPAEAHFGLGDAARLDRLEVRWPSGEVLVLEDVAVDRVLGVDEP